MRDNAMRKKLDAGEAVLGCWSTLGSPTILEIAGQFAFDWILIDCEHGVASYEALPDLLRALSGSSATSLVRVPGADDLAIFKRVLDAGVEGVVVPQIGSVEQVRRIVRACRYPPQGSRGIAAGRAQRYGADFLDTFRRSNSEVLVIVQVETKEAVDNLEEIMSTPGVDGVLVGFADLSAALGKPFELESAEFLAAIDKVLAVSKKTGKPAGYYCANPEEAKIKIAAGFRFVNLCSDTGLLMDGMGKNLAAMGQS